MNRFTQPTMNHHQTPPPHRKHRRLTKENSDPKLRSPALVGKPSPATATATAKTKSPLPPRPPRPLKRKLSVDSVPPDNVHPGCSSDSGVKVVVRMRPPSNEEKSGDIIVQRMSSDSLSINGQIFTFDSVADTTSSQDDIFHLVGAPLVENCLSGFNSSVFSYGQTGSGKTYTMWGPASTLLGENVSSELLGLTPRVLRRLFTRIKEEEINHADKQLIYQCRCSFLEIYNEQITDLLDPSQRNLHIREDIKSGVYVENLTEEHVPTMEDVIQILMKGLSNRRTGATTINAESSRSHSVFTCVVESRCKSVSDGLSSFKTSRINLVDLAGSERQKSTGAAGERLKEAGNINRSLSQLGNLINILAEVSQTGKQRHIPYRDSKLTFLLQESLGGNAKLAMICAISPSQSCKSETLSTLRFAQRAKAIKNKAVVNEVMQDDVNFLREVIRQLKDELLRMKENRSQTDPTGGYSTGWNARRSLNLLKFNLNRPMILPHVDNDSDVEMEIVEEANQLLVQLQDNKSSTAADGSNLETEEGDKDTDVTMEELISEEVDKHEISAVHCGESLHTIKPLKDNSVTPQNQSEGNDTDNSIHSQDKKRVKDSSVNTIRQCLSSSSSIVDKEAKNSTVNDTSKDMLINSVNTPSPCKLYSVLKSPTPSVSPTVNTNNPTQLRINISPPTEHLAASLHQGLEYIKNNRKSNALRRSSFSGSCKPTGINPTFPLNRVDVGVQTCPQESELVEKNSQPFLCTKCKTVNYQEDSKNTNETSNLELVPVAELESVEKTKIIVPKAVEKVLAGAIRREMAMEEFCNKQNTEIMQLNRLVQLYKHERECNTILGQTREDKITRLETRINDIMTTEDYVKDELASLKNENMYLKEKYKNHPEVLEAEIEFKRIQEELEQYRIFFELGEKGVLLEEIKDLRSQLQYYMDSSATSAIIQSPLLQLTYPCEPIESKYVEKLADMKIELEASLYLSDKLKRELEFEKICSEELKKAMQMAMEGHTRMLEQYADLEEKHIQLLSRHREIQNGINDVKKAARRAGVRGAESKFINALAAEISALKVEKQKERQYLRDENKGLQSQLGDMANAVQAAGELLVRLKEAEEAVAIFQNRAMEAEKEAEKAYKHINRLKRKHDKEINSLHELLEKSRLRSKQSPNNAVKSDIGQSQNRDGRQQREEFHLCQNSVEGELSKPEEPPSWFSGYDRCNI